MEIQVLIKNNTNDEECWVSVNLFEEDYIKLNKIGLTAEDIEDVNYTILKADFDTIKVDFFDEDDTIEDYVELQDAYNFMHGYEQKVLDSILEADYYTINSVNDIIEMINDNTVDKWTLYSGMSMAQVAEEYVNECFDIPDSIKYYIDFDNMGRDMMLDGNYYEVSNGVLCYVG